MIASRRDAMAAARAEAERLGFTAFVVDEAIAGEARDAAPRLLAQADALVRDRVRHGPCCVIASGETTVRVTGSGRGGRNQEFALALVERLAAPPGERARSWVVAASIGTDGIDGPTDAAGGMVDSTTLQRARAAGIGEPSAFLANNDAYRFLDAVGDLVKTGPTDTNVGDMQILVYNPHRRALKTRPRIAASCSVFRGAPMTKTKLGLFIALGVLVAAIAGWLYGWSGTRPLAREVAAKTLRLQLTEARMKILDARVDVYTANFGNASRNLEHAKGPLQAYR